MRREVIEREREMGRGGRKNRGKEVKRTILLCFGVKIDIWARIKTMWERLLRRRAK